MQQNQDYGKFLITGKALTLIRARKIFGDKVLNKSVLLDKAEKNLF